MRTAANHPLNRTKVSIGVQEVTREHFAGLIEIATRAAEVENPFEALGVLLRGLLDAQLGLHSVATVLTEAVDVEPATTRAKDRARRGGHGGAEQGATGSSGTPGGSAAICRTGKVLQL
jgi:hypothetical protein